MSQKHCIACLKDESFNSGRVNIAYLFVQRAFVIGISIILEDIRVVCSLALIQFAIVCLLFIFVTLKVLLNFFVLARTTIRAREDQKISRARVFVCGFSR